MRKEYEMFMLTSALNSVSWSVEVLIKTLMPYIQVQRRMMDKAIHPTANPFWVYNNIDKFI